MSLSRRGDRAPLFARHRTGDPVPAVEQREAVTMEIAPPTPPETAAVTEVIVQPEPGAPKLAVIANEDALNLFGGRRSSSFSAPVRQAYLDAIGGVEPTFRSVVADHAEWAYLLDTSLPAPPRKGGTTDPAPGATTAGEGAAIPVPAPDPSPDAPGAVIPGPEAEVAVAAPAAAAVSGPASNGKSGTSRPAKKRPRAAGA